MTPRGDRARLVRRAWPVLVLAIVRTAPLGSQATAETPVAPVPERLPASQREELEQRRRALLSRVDAFNALAPEFLARCGQVPAEQSARLAACQAEVGRLTVRQQEIVGDKTMFAAAVDSAVKRLEQACPTIDAQLARDREALRRQQGVSASTSAELEAWARENEDSQRSAMMLGVKALMGEAAGRLAARQARVTALQSAVARNERLLGERGIAAGPVKARLAWLAGEYGRAQAQANVGGAIVRAGEIDALYELVRTEAGVIAKEMATTDDAAREALADPAIAAIVNVDASASDLARQTLDQLVATPGFERFAPQYALASFVVDYGYDATRWALSGQRILQGGAVSERSLEAVAALTRQIRRTVEWQSACRRAGAALMSPQLREPHLLPQR